MPQSRPLLRPALFVLAVLAGQWSAMAQPAPSVHEKTLTVDEAIAIALEHNRTLGLAGINVKHMQAMKDKARADYIFKITNSSQTLRLSDLQNIVIPAGSFGSTPQTGPVPARSVALPQGGLQSYMSSTSLLQPTTQLFKVHETNHAAQLDVETARVDLEQAKEDIALQVRQLFYTLQVDRKQLEAADAALAATQESDREANASVTGGASLQTSSLEQRADVLQQKESSLKIRLAIRDSTLELNDALGLPLDTQLQLEDFVPSRTSDIPTREEGTRLALEKEPKVRSAMLAVEKARTGVKIAQEAFIPSVDLYAHQSYQSGIPFFVHNFGAFGVTFHYDLFDGGERNAEIRNTHAQLEAAELSLVQQQESTRIAVEDAYDQEQLAVDAVAIAEDLLVLRTESARIAEADYEQGSILASKRDSARAAMLSAQASATSALLDLDLARDKVKTVLGEIAR